MTEIRWHGRGGQGAFTASKILGEAAMTEAKLFSLAFPAFGPERRGAPVLAFNKIDSKKIANRSEIRRCDYIIILDEALFSETLLLDLKSDGRLILNTSNNLIYSAHKKIITIDANKIALEILKLPIANTAMLGALLGASDLFPLVVLTQAANHYFDRKNADNNIEVIETAFRVIREKLHE